MGIDRICRATLLFWAVKKHVDALILPYAKEQRKPLFPASLNHLGPETPFPRS